MTVKTSISMVLDRSGSMSSCRGATIDAVNKYLLEARQDENLKDADFDLTIFDSNAIESIRQGTPATCADITEDDYSPRGGTPLYDAIGRSIDGLDVKTAGSGKAILVVVTDGEENASRKHTHEAISSLIKARQDAGWLVVFLGAGLNSAIQGARLGVHAGYVANISMDSASLSATMASVGLRSRGYGLTSGGANSSAWVNTSSNNFNAVDRKAMGDATGGDSLLKKQPAKAAKPVPPVVSGNAIKDDSWSAPKGDAWGA